MLDGILIEPPKRRFDERRFFLGPKISSGKQVQATFGTLAPTTLNLMNIPIPNDLNGNLSQSPQPKDKNLCPKIIYIKSK